MPLTPEDVRNRLFTTVRLREGYDQTEVDEFLDMVEAELQRLLAENDDLRQKVLAAQQGIPVELPPAPVDVREPGPPPAVEEPAEVEAPPVPVKEIVRHEIVVHSDAEVGEAAAKVLQMAQRTADEVIAEARTEAQDTVAEAKEQAEQLTSEAREQADRLDRETRERTAALDQQLEDERQTALGKLEVERTRLAQEVEGLRAFEREYRGRLRSFLEGQLTQLASRGSDDTPLAPGANQVDHDDLGTTEVDHGAGADETPAPPAHGSPGTRGALGRILEEEERRSEDES